MLPVPAGWGARHLQNRSGQPAPSFRINRPLYPLQTGGKRT